MDDVSQDGKVKKMKNMPKRVAIYSRKSKFTGKGESIGNQVELCREFIRLHMSDVQEKDVLIFEDEGFSGGNLDRPDFKKMMKAARTHEIQAIVVYRLDRISRNISDFSTLIEELGRLDVAFISIREQFDTGSPMGRAMMYIASVFSQLERETIAERIRDNMHELAKTGRWLGGITPTGYASESIQTVTVDGKAKKACMLRLVDEEAQVVRLVYDLFLETQSLTATEAELMRRGVMTKNGLQFTRFSIKSILQNPVYLMADEEAYDYFLSKEADIFSERSAFDGIHGIMAYNRTDQNKGKSTVYLPVAEWIIAVGKHIGLIPSKTWLDVQRLLEQNKSKGFRRPRSHEALLTGILFCACGNRMYPKITKRPVEGGRFQFTYVCKMKERSKKELCNCKNVRGDELDAAVMKEFCGLNDSPVDFVTQLEQSKKLYAGSRDEYSKSLDALCEEGAKIAKKVAGLIDSMAEMSESEARRQIVKRIEELNKEEKGIQSRIAELEAQAKQQTLSDNEFDIMCRRLSVFATSFDGLSIQQRRSAVRSLIYRIIWDGKQAHMIYFGAEDNGKWLEDISDDMKDDMCTEKACIKTIGSETGALQRCDDSK